MRFLSQILGRTGPANPGSSAGARAEPTLGTPVQSATEAGAGIAAAAPDTMLAEQEEWVSRIKLAFGIAAADFETRVQPLLVGVARFVNRLPAGCDEAFSEPGGQLRLCLQTAFFALQGADGQIFTGHTTISERKSLEEKWRLATFIAGLCAELHRPLAHLKVIAGAEQCWPAYLMPLTDWLDQRKARHFTLRWADAANEARATAIFALRMVVPAATLDFLSRDNDMILPHMMAAITGTASWSQHNIITELVRTSSAAVHAHEQQAVGARTGRPPSTAFWARHLVDGARSLIASDTSWMPNGPKSRVWLGQDGLFLAWPGSGADLIKLLDQHGMPAVPKSPDVVAEILIDAGVLEPGREGNPVLKIEVADRATPIDAVMLTVPAILLNVLDEVPAPLERRLRANSGTPEAPSPSADRPPPAAGSGPKNGPPNPQENTRSSPPRPAKEAARFCPLPQVFKLKAPLSLNPMVAAALHSLLDQLSQHGQHPTAVLVEQGLVVTDATFLSHRVDATLAIRALTDANMVVLDSEGKLLREPVAGDRTGIVIAASFITGLEEHVQAALHANREKPDAG